MDAVLLVSFGGPESMDEVMPFLRRVTAGRNVPEQRLLAVAEHYFDRGGVSPINAQNRELVHLLQRSLAPEGLMVYWGNRNSAPWLQDTFARMQAAGVTRAIAVFTSAFSSYSGCRQYRENLAAAAPAGPGIEVVKIPAYYNMPGFVQANLEHLLDELQQVPHDSHLAFVTHSIPVAMQESSGPGGEQYVAQHRALAAHLVAEVAHVTGREYPWELVFQSRSGPPQVPWLEPDVNAHLAALGEQGVGSVAVVPIGFVSDHMEVVQDLDTEAADTAGGLGMRFARVPTAGHHPAFVSGLVDAVLAVREGRSPVTAFGEPLPAPCVHGCCPNPRGAKPALCEQPA
jgi:ferrochelatase